MNISQVESLQCSAIITTDFVEFNDICGTGSVQTQNVPELILGRARDGEMKIRSVFMRHDDVLDCVSECICVVLVILRYFTSGYLPITYLYVTMMMLLYLRCARVPG